MKIKILIPVYNDWQSVFKLLENINSEVSNLDHEFSVIIVNDASTENKPEFVKGFVKKYWKDSKAKGRIILNKKSKVKFDHISDKKSVWKLTAV